MGKKLPLDPSEWTDAQVKTAINACVKAGRASLKKEHGLDAKAIKAFEGQMVAYLGYAMMSKPELASLEFASFWSALKHKIDQ